MKFRLILFILFIMVVNVQVSGKNVFLIEGKIDNLSAPAKIYLFYYDPVSSRPILDSTYLDGGKFTFRGTIDYPVYARMVYAFNGDISYATAGDERRFYLEAGKITIEGKQLFNARIMGSKTQDLLMEYFAMIQPVQKKIIQTRNDRDDIYKPYSATYRGSLDSLVTEYTKEYNQLSMDFVKAHLDNILAVDMLQSEIAAHPENEEVEILYNHLSDNIRNSPPGKRLSQSIRNTKRIRPGNIAPNFTAGTLQGNTISLSDYRGKWVLLTFESPTCDICHSEAQELARIYSQYKGKGFEIIGFMLEEAEAKHQWNKFINDLNLPYVTVSDLKAWSSPIVDQYKINAVPENYLINPDGLVVAIDLYGSDLVDRLQDILK